MSLAIVFEFIVLIALGIYGFVTGESTLTQFICIPIAVLICCLAIWAVGKPERIV